MAGQEPKKPADSESHHGLSRSEDESPLPERHSRKSPVFGWLAFNTLLVEVGSLMIVHSIPSLNTLKPGDFFADSLGWAILIGTLGSIFCSIFSVLALWRKERWPLLPIICWLLSCAIWFA